MANVPREDCFGLNFGLKRLSVLCSRGLQVVSYPDCLRRLCINVTLDH